MRQVSTTIPVLIRSCTTHSASSALTAISNPADPPHCQSATATGRIFPAVDRGFFHSCVIWPRVVPEDLTIERRPSTCAVGSHTLVVWRRPRRATAGMKWVSGRRHPGQISDRTGFPKSEAAQLDGAHPRQISGRPGSAKLEVAQVDGARAQHCLDRENVQRVGESGLVEVGLRRDQRAANGSKVGATSTSRPARHR
jgi:hypothetical protein